MDRYRYRYPDTGAGDTNLTVEGSNEGDVVFADVSGFERSSIDLRFEDGRLSIAAERDTTDEFGGVTRRRRRRVGESVRVPGDVVVEDVTASYRNGVLEVHLPVAGTDRDGGHRIDID